MEVKPFLKLMYVNSLNGTSALYVPESSNYTTVISGSTTNSYSITEGAKAAGIIELADTKSKGYNFYGGKGFGDSDKIIDPESGEMIELSWEKFFSSQEYAQKIMKAIYANTINTINAHNTSGTKIQNKFKDAKFGIGIVQNKANPFVKEFYKFDNIQDVSKIPTMVFDDIEVKTKDNPFAISSTRKYIGPIMSNVNGGKVNVPYMYYVRNDHLNNYMTYDYENATNSNPRHSYFAQSQIPYNADGTGRDMALKQATQLGYEFMKKYFKLGVYFDDETSRAAGQVKILDNKSAAQPGTVPFPLKYPSLWFDLDWEVEKPYEDTDRWKREEHGRGFETNYTFVKLEISLTGKHTAINLGGNVWQVVQEGKESRKFKLDSSMQE